MSAKRKREILPLFSVPDLKEIANEYGLEKRGLNKADLVELIAVKRNIGLETLLSPYYKEALIVFCQKLNLQKPVASYSKPKLIAYLLEGDEKLKAQVETKEIKKVPLKAKIEIKPQKIKEIKMTESKIENPPKIIKTAKAKSSTHFEESLWDSANKLRGSVESSEYKHIVLSLIFLKFISDKFEAQHEKLIAEGMGDFLDQVEFYAKDNVFFLTEDSSWNYLLKHAKQDDIALKIDTALHNIEKSNKSLAGALPDNYFSRLGLDASKLSALLDTINNINTLANECELSEEDLVGRVYEYFLGKFAASEGKGGGEFYTPKSIVALLAEMIEPYKGKIYDPCCGSGGMFVQSLKFVSSHNGNKKDISIYGQEYTNATYKLAKMNLAVRGISGNLGDVAGDTFFKDQHPDLKADFIMANPPFNQSQWRADNELTDDARWRGYTTPPTGNANYAWILHMLSKLSESGIAGFILANGSMSTNTSGEGAIRQEIIDNDHVECMIALPGQLFYTTQIPVCMWFLSKNKKENKDKSYRDRQGETLFIDARQMGTMISRTNKELTIDDIAKISETYHAWRSNENKTSYKDEAGYCKSASLDDIKANDYVLTPGRYVGAADIEDDGIPFETKMKELSKSLYQQMEESKNLDKAIKNNLEVLGYGE